MTGLFILLTIITALQKMYTLVLSQQWYRVQTSSSSHPADKKKHIAEIFVDDTLTILAWWRCSHFGWLNVQATPGQTCVIAAICWSCVYSRRRALAVRIQKCITRTKCKCTNICLCLVSFLWYHGGVPYCVKPRNLKFENPHLNTLQPGQYTSATPVQS